MGPGNATASVREDIQDVMSTTMTTGKFTSSKLTEENWVMWSWEFLLAADHHGVMKILEGAESQPTDSATTADFQRKCKLAMSQLVKCIDDCMKIKIVGERSPEKAWKSLKTYHEGKSRSEVQRRRRELDNLQWKDFPSMSAFLDKVKSMTKQLETMSVKLDEEDIIVLVLSKLPHYLKHAAAAIRSERGDQKRSLDEVIKFLIDEADIEEAHRKKSHGAGGRRGDRFKEESEAAFSVQSKRDKMRGQQDKRRFVKNKDITCYRCQKPGHIARNCNASDSQHTPSALHASFMATVVECADRKTEWWIDSGSTAHMTNDASKLFNTRSPETKSVMIGDGSKMEVTSVGDYSQGQVTLLNVLYVPNLKANLMSISCALDNGVDKIEFRKNGVEIVKDGNVIATGTRDGLLFRLDPTNITSKMMKDRQKPPAKASYQTWHLRLGHLHYPAIKKLHDKGYLKATGKIPKQPCASCVMSKLSRKPFSQGPIIRSQSVGETMHSDVCGPFEVAGSNNARYFVTFIDDMSRFIAIYPIAKKSEVYKKFTEFQAAMEVEFGRQTIKELISDNGGEYSSDMFRQYCRSKGIKHTFTIPHTPQQNGIAERANRTIMEGARAMMRESTMPCSSWSEAVVYAAYVRNRSPSRTIEDKLPFEVRFGKTPDLSKMRIFGSKVFYHVPKSERSKLNSKACEGKFVGIPASQFGFLIRSKAGKIVASRDVVFMEQDSEEAQECEEDDQQEISPLLQQIITQNKRKEEEHHTEDDFKDCKDIEDVESQEPVTTERERRIRKQTDLYAPEDFRRKRVWSAEAYMASTCSITPSSRKEALSQPDAVQWIQAMDKEIESHKSNGTWKLVQRPCGVNIVGSKWAYRIKNDEDGNLKQFKARLCAKGFSQIPGIDFEETFAPVVSMAAFRLVFAIAASARVEVHHMDVATAFLNAKLNEDIYMQQPEGYRVEGENGVEMVCKLEKALYGLKQAGREWWRTVLCFLQKLGFTSCPADQCLFIKRTKSDFVISALYVDDFIIAASNPNELESLKKSLSEEYKTKDMGALTHALGIKVDQDIRSGKTTLSLGAYIEAMLKRFNMQDSKPAHTPMISEKITGGNTQNTDDLSKFPYRECIGALTFAAYTARPDIAFSVSRCARNVEAPTSEDVIAVKRILRYLQGTRGLGIVFTQKVGEAAPAAAYPLPSTSRPPALSAYVDADWANSKDRKSTTGFLINYGGPVTWGSRRQKCVALSSTEAEYVAASHAAQQVKWLRHLLGDLGLKQKSPTTIFEDNQSCIKLIEMESMSQRSKHIDIKYHHIQDEQKKANIKLQYIPSEENIADMLTKPLAVNKLRKFRDQVMTQAGTVKEGVGNDGAAFESASDNPEAPDGGVPGSTGRTTLNDRVTRKGVRA